jgi:integrase
MGDARLRARDAALTAAPLACTPDVGVGGPVGRCSTVSDTLNTESSGEASGLRQSEEIALRVHNCDLAKGTIKICEVVVLRQHKDRPKNNEDRNVELCPRALSVLKRQFALREAYAKAGKIKHDFVFFRDDGKPIRELKYVYMRWRYVIEERKVLYREPYNARHSCVSWNLMIGKNLMWCARQHGHSVQVMLTMYGAWIEGSTDEDIAVIKSAMEAQYRWLGNPIAKTTVFWPQVS